MTSEEMCQAHPSQFTNFFCEECGIAICILCKVGFHKLHPILKITDKYEILKGELRQCLKNSLSPGALLGRLTTLEYFQPSFERNIQSAREQLENRYSAVKEQLETIYKRYCSELHRKLVQFLEEKERLKILQEIQKDTKILLTESFSSILLRRSQRLLMVLQKLLPEKHEVLSKPTFVNPRNGSDVCSRTFQSLCDNSILGYIAYGAIDEDYPVADVPNVPLREFGRSEASLDTIPECSVFGRQKYAEVVDLEGSDKIDKEALKEARTVPSLKRTILDLLRRKVTVVLVNGERCIVRGPNSDVILHVPKGVYGAILVRIHTSNARFMHLIPNDDCLVSPVCEYHLQESLYKSAPKVGRFNIEIPNILKERLEWRREYIRVRYGSLHSGRMIKLDFPWFGDQRGPVNYGIQREHVSIFTRHLCGFIVTAESVNCCGSTANIHVFRSQRIPSWRIGSSALPALVTVEIYLSSIHSDIKDYLLDLERNQHKRCDNMILLHSRNIPLHTEEYDVSESEIRLELEATDRTRLISQVTPLHKTLKSNNGHICKMKPTEVGIFGQISKKPLKVTMDIKWSKRRSGIALKRHVFGKWVKEESYQFDLDIRQTDQTDGEHMTQNPSRISSSSDSSSEDSGSDVALSKTEPITEMDRYLERKIDRNKNLTDRHIIEVASRLTSPSDVRRLGLELGVAHHKIDSHINNNKYTITTAAYYILQEWCETQSDREEAFTNLCDALKRAGMRLFASKLRYQQYFVDTMFQL